MACKSGSKTYGPIPVWSKGSTSVWLFHPLTPPMDSTGIAKVRVSMELSQDTGNTKIRPAVRMSNDGVTWGAAVTIGADVQTGDGTLYADDFETISTTTVDKQLAQFGVEVANASGTAYEQGMASIKVDVE